MSEPVVTIGRMDHVGVVVEDLQAAIEFFVHLGFERGGGGSVEGGEVDRVVGLEGVRTDFAFVQTPDGHSRLELIEFRSPRREADDEPPPSNAPGLRHIALAVDDLDAAVAGLRARGHDLVGGIESFGNAYRLCYVRGPAGIIVELAERIG